MNVVTRVLAPVRLSVFCALPTQWLKEMSTSVKAPVANTGYCCVGVDWVSRSLLFDTEERDMGT